MIETDRVNITFAQLREALSGLGIFDIADKDRVMDNIEMIHLQNECNRIDRAEAIAGMINEAEPSQINPAGARKIVEALHSFSQRLIAHADERLKAAEAEVGAV